MLLRDVLITCCIFFSFSLTHASPPFELPDKHELQKIRGAILTTNKGKIYIRLFPDKAPWHVANLKYLADKKFYHGLPFHLFRRNYLIQTGAPNKNPASGPNYTLPAEFNSLKHAPGALSMVRKPDYLDLKHTRNSHGSQFRIMLKHTSAMDGQYTVFGQVIKGIDVAKELRLGDKIISLVVYVKEESFFNR